MVRHLIVFNSPATAQAVQAMAARAAEVLGVIPVVTDIRFGVAVAQEARYRYFVDIGLVDQDAIQTYLQHPVHVRFAQEEFRPLAPDRITTD